MTRRWAASFHQLSEAAVDARAWTYALNGADGGLVQAILPDWDYGAVLLVERLVAVDWARAASDLAFADRFDMELIVEIGTGPGAIAREVVGVERVRLPYGCAPQLVTVGAPSRLLSHQLVLRSSIILTTAGRAVDPLTPHPGARMWGDRTVSRLEGDDPRFPMEVIDFARHFAGRPQADAPWFVGWSTGGANRDFRGAFRLYLNAGQPEVLQRIQDQDPIVLQALMGDVVSQVCEGLLREEDGAALDDIDEGSLADQVSHWLERAFGDVAAARAILEQRPAEFRAAILSSVRL
jgi:hypothetical protein